MLVRNYVYTFSYLRGVAAMRFVLVLLIAFMVSACGDGRSSPILPPSASLDLPIADAGQDVTLQQGMTVVLNGSASHDPKGASLSYQWSVVSKPASSSSDLSDPSSPFPSFYLDAVGDYTFELVVNNGEADSLPARVTISDSDSTPVANAGPDLNFTLNMAVTLDGSRSYDSDGDALSYAWAVVQSPSGSTATLNRADTAFPVFTPDVSGDYSFELVVSDGQKSSAPDIVILSSNNIAPIANAGADQRFTVGAMVSLDGSKSSDVDGDTLAYQWHIVSAPAGSAAALQDADQVVSTLTPDVWGDYVIALVVNDGTVDSSPSTTTLRAGGHRPIASAGMDQSVVLGQTVHLDGSLSTDLDGDSLTASWSMVSKPKNSAASLTDIHTMHPQFTPDADGDYVVALTVFDGSQTSATDTVVLSTKNLAPVAHAGQSMSLSVGTVSHLNGSQSSDPEGQPLTYSWSILSAPRGSTASLSDTSVVAPDFTADVAGTYKFQLVVNDGARDSAPSTVILTETDLPPVADAGLDQTARNNVTVSLSGTSSSDPEGQALSYAWSFISIPATSSAQLSDADQVVASFTPDVTGDYVVQLVVTDAAGQTSVDAVVIRDSSRNTLPVANAGKDLQVDLNANLVLDGSGSSDADGDSLAYSWAILSRPAGSTAQLNDADTRSPNFTPDVEGDFVVQLVVSDGQSVSLPDVVMIHDTKRNLAPDAVIVNSGDGITGQSYQLSGLSSTDPNGDPLTYRWSFFFKPTGSSASFDDATAAEPTFTPDAAGYYYISLIVNDGVLDSFSTATTVLVADPAQGAAISIPSGHNLMMLSAIGGASGSGALVSMPEKDLSNTTEIFSFHGVSGMVETYSQSVVAHEPEGLMYALIAENGAYRAGSIVTYDPATDELKTFAHIPNTMVNGHRLRFTKSKLLFHHNGKDIFTFSSDGGLKDAGLLLHINNDSASSHYRRVSVIGEFGAVSNNFPGSLRAPVTDLYWNGGDKLLALYGRNFSQQLLPGIEFTPTNANDFSQSWVADTWGSSTVWSRTRSFVVEDGGDSLVTVTSISPPIVENTTKDGGGGTAMRDCRDPESIFRLGSVRVFILCESGSSDVPVLIETNMRAFGPSVVRTFGTWNDVEIGGAAASNSLEQIYIVNSDENYRLFGSASLLSSVGISIRPPELAVVTRPNYTDRPLITGNDTYGWFFLGDPAVLSGGATTIDDQYVTALSLDGGDYDAGALLTYNRAEDKITMATFGFEAGGFPFGRPLKMASGDFVFSALETRSSQGSGGIMLYNSAFGVVTEAVAPSRIRTGIAHALAANGDLYGVGIDLHHSQYVLYKVDGSNMGYTSIGVLAATSDRIPNYEATVDEQNVWGLDDYSLYCFALDGSTKSSYFLPAAGLEEAVYGIVFPTAGGDGFIATRESHVAGQGTIQRVSNQCSATSVTASVSGLSDLPSTALLAASDGFMYYGTDGGKLMKYDESLNAVSEVAVFANTSVVGFLTEDSNGDIVGVLSDGDAANDQIFAYSLATFATVTKAVPADTPVDVHYPGLIEIN